MRHFHKSHIIFLLDISLTTLSFLFFIWLKPASRRVYLPQYLLPFIGFCVLWIILSLVFDKYNFKHKQSPNQYILPVLKTSITSLVIVLLLVFIFNLLHYSRLIVLGTIFLVTFLELFFSTILYYHRKLNREYDLPSKLTKHATVIHNGFVDKGSKDYSFPDLDNLDDTIAADLQGKYLSHSEELLKYITSKIKLHGIHKHHSLILNTHTLYNIENIDPESQQLFINLHKINDIRRINRFFIQVNSNLQFGGYFVGTVETIKEKHKRYQSKYPLLVFKLIHTINFLFTRVFPKIAILKEIYFAITKGNNRSISKAEILGRLSFCGFKIIGYTEIENQLYFIGQKFQKPKEDMSPSYSPLIKLPRIGENGRIIYIYKLRTMHPYSEYLQDYIHEQYELHASGKFKNDFRITVWGKIFRKCWIDELPQFINLVRGDICIVGVRALSTHYFNLYPDDVKEMRIKFKPGLIPPYYADMPKEFDEIVESEKKYLEKKKKQPFKTDLHYFFKAWGNILFKGARSK